MKNNSTNFPFLAHIKWTNILKKHQKRHQTLIVKLNWTKVIAKRKIPLWRKKVLIPNIWSFQSWTKCWCYSVPKTNDTQILNVYNVGVRWSGTCARLVIVVNFLTYFIILNHANVVDIVVTSKRMFQEPGGQDLVCTLRWMIASRSWSVVSLTLRRIATPRTRRLPTLWCTRTVLELLRPTLCEFPSMPKSWCANWLRPSTTIPLKTLARIESVPPPTSLTPPTIMTRNCTKWGHPTDTWE